MGFFLHIVMFLTDLVLLCHQHIAMHPTDRLTTSVPCCSSTVAHGSGSRLLAEGKLGRTEAVKMMWEVSTVLPESGGMP